MLLQPLRLRPRAWTAAQHCRQGRAVETKCPCCLLTPSAPGAGNTHFLLNVSSSFFRVICTDCSLPSKSFILQRPKHWREARPPATSRTGTPSRQGPHQAAGRPLPPRGCRRDPHRASFMAARSLSSQAARCSRSSSSELVACALCRDSAAWAPASLRAASSSFSSFTWGTGRAFRVEVGKRRHPVSGLGDSVLTQPLWAAGYPQWGLHDPACGPSSPVTRLVAWHGL